eukprot:GHVL01033007.1.p1 GENE.GHVL01033007.1~~GHVL01033007.1.p1  ORF type:complete len:122 (+),score=5.46 GHVL01033007.1:35-400(+)
MISVNVIKSVWNDYEKKTPDKAKLCDLFMLFLFLILLVQVCYALIAGLVPYNSFLSGLLSSIGTMTFTGRCICHNFYTVFDLGCLRLQIMKPDEFKMSTQRLFADYLVTLLVFQVALVNYL